MSAFSSLSPRKHCPLQAPHLPHIPSASSAGGARPHVGGARLLPARCPPAARHPPPTTRVRTWGFLYFSDSFTLVASLPGSLALGAWFWGEPCGEGQSHCSEQMMLTQQLLC